MFVFLIVHVRHTWTEINVELRPSVHLTDQQGKIKHERTSRQRTMDESTNTMYCIHHLRGLCVCVSLTVNQFVVVCVCVLSVYFIIVKSQHLSHTHTVCLSIVLSWSIIPVSGICSHPALTLFFLFHYRFVLSVCCVFCVELTGSEPQSSRLLRRTAPATSPTSWPTGGWSAWREACPCRPASQWTGSAAPGGNRPVAEERRGKN